jgi:thioester reductase-like protein
MLRAMGETTELLLTGATGFVGKVVLCELLRRADELRVGRVYVLVRASDQAGAAQRFAKEIAASPALGWASAIDLERCVPVAGDITKPDLGLDAETLALLGERLTLIVHCAATVEFDLPLAEATVTNTSGPLNVLGVAKRCPNLRRMVDVSTAYVTPHPGERGSAHDVAPALVPLPFDADAVYREILAGRADERRLLAQTGHPNTYTFTKCLAENLLARERGSVPLTIVRPSIVSASMTHPYPGWIDSLGAFGGFVAATGSGVLRVVAAHNETFTDIVPCDRVADRIIAAAFAPADADAEEVLVQHAAAGPASQTTNGRIARILEAHFAGRKGRAVRLHAVGNPFLRRVGAWLAHDLPFLLLTLWALVRGRRRDARRAGRIRSTLRRMTSMNHYVLTRTFHFHGQDAGAAFDGDAYIRSVAHGVDHFLLRRLPPPIPALSAPAPVVASPSLPPERDPSPAPETLAAG